MVLVSCSEKEAKGRFKFPFIKSKLSLTDVQTKKFDKIAKKFTAKAWINNTKTPETYAQIQAIAEHPFGTIKRQWDFDHIITKKSIKRAFTDVALFLLPAP